MNQDELERYAASVDLVVFLNRYTELVESQLSSIREIIENAVRSVMEGVSALADETASKAAEANAVLDQTYMNPDQNTATLVTQIQSSVDDVFEMALKGEGKSSINNSDKEKKDLVEENLRRLGGQFSKHMEAVGTMDEVLGNILVEMMGALSTDDLIRQKLEHIQLMVHGLQVGLSYIMIDFKNKFSSKEIDTLIADLLNYSYSSYTAEVEKDTFRKRFLEPAKVPFSIFR